MDEKRRNRSGRTSQDAIEVDESPTDDSSPTASSKRQRQEEVPDSAKGSAVLYTQGGSIEVCPIKLLATHEDEKARKIHWEQTANRLDWSYSQCWTLREMLGLDRHIDDNYGDDKIDWLVISNFIVDFDFLLSELPEIVCIPSVIVIYGHADDADGINKWRQRATNSKVEFLRRDPSDGRLSTSNPLSISIPFGCHHTKLFLVGYSSGRLRVIVHTTNLRYADVHRKCQGAFLQDFFLKEDEYKTSEFEETLISYISTYRYLNRHAWQVSDPEQCSLMDQISKYDFATAKGVLIPSSPGFHSAQGGASWGYLAVRKAIQDILPKSLRGGSIVCQFSSIGSLSENYLKSLWSAWDTMGNRPVRFQLIYPTYQEIKESVEGLRGGGSVPGTCKNVGKSFLQPLWHKWNSSSSMNKTLGKGQNVPHIKTYYQVDEQGQNMHWFMLGSHNLSKGMSWRWYFLPTVAFFGV